jgi:hypothetical protein
VVLVVRRVSKFVRDSLENVDHLPDSGGGFVFDRGMNSKALMAMQRQGGAGGAGGALRQ